MSQPKTATFQNFKSDTLYKDFLDIINSDTFKKEYIELADKRSWLFRVKVDLFEVEILKKDYKLFFMDRLAYCIACKLYFSEQIRERKFNSMWKALHICAYSKCSHINDIKKKDLIYIFNNCQNSDLLMHSYLDQTVLNCCKYLK